MKQPLEILIFGAMYNAGAIVINGTINKGNMGANSYAVINASTFFEAEGDGRATNATCKKACKAYIIPDGGKTTDWEDVTFAVGDVFVHHSVGVHPGTKTDDYASMIFVYKEL